MDMKPTYLRLQPARVSRSPSCWRPLRGQRGSQSKNVGGKVPLLALCPSFPCLFTCVSRIGRHLFVRNSQLRTAQAKWLVCPSRLASPGRGICQMETIHSSPPLYDGLPVFVLHVWRSPFRLLIQQYLVYLLQIESARDTSHPTEDLYASMTFFGSPVIRISP